MNRKKDPNQVRDIHYLVRLNKNENEKFLKKLEEASGMKSTDFIRSMICSGYVQAPTTKSILLDSRRLLGLLMEYRTNFSRISNMIKYKHPELHHEIENTAKAIQRVIDMI